MAELVFKAPLIGATSVFTLSPLKEGVQVLGASVKLTSLGITTPAPSLSVTSFTQRTVTIGWSNFVPGFQVDTDVTLYVSEAVVPGSLEVINAETLVIAGDVDVRGEITFSGPVDLDGGTINKFYIDSTVYGVSTTNSGTANNAAFALAYAAAKAFSPPKEIWLPAGTLDFNGHDLINPGGYDVQSACPIDTSIKIVGRGKGLTTMRMTGYVGAAYTGPFPGIGYVITQLNDNSAAMFCTKNVDGITLHLVGITLEGPPFAALTMDQQNCYGIYSGSSGLELEDVGFRNWMDDIKCSNVSSGVGTALNATLSEFRWRVLAVLHGGAPGDGAQSVYTRCVFNYETDAPPLLFSTEGGQSNGAYHALYIGNSVGLSTLGCNFISTGGISGFGWRHFSVEADSDPPFSMSVEDTFGYACKAAYCTHKTYPSTIIGATIEVGTDQSGITAFGPCRIFDTTLVGETGGAGAVYGITDGSSTSGRPTIRNVVFRGDFLYSIRRIQNVSAAWELSGIEFNANSSGGGCGLKVDGGDVNLDQAVFDITTGSASWWVSGGTLRTSNIRHTVTSKTPLINNDTAASAVVFGPSPNDTGRPLVLALTSTVALSGVAPSAQGIAINSSTGVAGLTGQMQLPAGIGTVARSSDVLTVDANANNFLLNIGGGPTFNTIYVANSVSGGATDTDILRAYTCRLSFLIQQACTFGAAGNIVAAGGARAVGSVVTFQLYPTYGGVGVPKWVEV